MKGKGPGIRIVLLQKTSSSEPDNSLMIIISISYHVDNRVDHEMTRSPKDHPPPLPDFPPGLILLCLLLLLFPSSSSSISQLPLPQTLPLPLHDPNLGHPLEQQLHLPRAHGRLDHVRDGHGADPRPGRDAAHDGRDDLVPDDLDKVAVDVVPDGDLTREG